MARRDQSTGSRTARAGKGSWLIPTAAVVTVLAGAVVGIGAIASRRLFSQLPGYSDQAGDDR